MRINCWINLLYGCVVLCFLTVDVQAADIDGEIYATTEQSDGKILIGGNFQNYNYTEIRRIARINPNGTLDTSFNPGTGANGEVWDIELTTDGKIFIAGGFDTYNGSLNYFIVRLNADGSLDTSFNPGESIQSWIYDAAVQSDGKVVIGGLFSWIDPEDRNYIARLNTDGSLDTSFNVGTGCDGYVQTIAIQSDGKIIIGGEFTAYNDIARNRIARLNADGSLDTTFDPGSGANGRILATKILSDGKILIGGEFVEYDGVARNRIARLNVDGSLDTTFDSSNGPNSWGDVVWDIDVQMDNKILISGGFWDYDSQTVENIARLNVDGSLDTTFDSDAGADDIIFSASILTDNRIAIGGWFDSYKNFPTPYFAILDSDGALYQPNNISDLTESIIPHEFIGGGIEQGWRGDEETWAYQLPFDFTFYGVTYPAGTSIGITSNGQICLEDHTNCADYDNDISSTTHGSFIAPFWYDFDSTNTGGIYITENVDNVIFRWETEEFGVPGPVINFEAILYNNGNLKFNYGSQNVPLQNNVASVGISNGDGIYTASVYDGYADFNLIDTSAWGEFLTDGKTTQQSGTNQLSATIAENMTLSCGTDIDLNGGTPLIPQTPATSQTTCTVTTNDANGYDLQLTNDRGSSNTLYHTTQSASINGQITDKSRWNPSSPNATNFTGEGLAFGILASDATKNTSWWGDAAMCSSTDQLYAGIPASSSAIMEHTSYSNTPTDTTICYQVNVPSTQISGLYEGSVTYTATGRP